MSPGEDTPARSLTRLADGPRSRDTAGTASTGAGRWRTPAIVAVSVIGHLALLAVLGLREIDPRTSGRLRIDPRPIVYLQIEPRPLAPGEAARLLPGPDRPQAVSMPSSPTVAVRVPPVRDPDEDEVPAVVSPAPVDRWTVRPPTMGDSIARGLRTRGLGCADPTVLSAVERAICDDRFGRRAASAPPISGTGNPERDARFSADGARRLADYERRRRGLSGRPGVTLPDDCGGSNLGFSCAGGHLRPEFRQDRESTLNQNLGADRGDPTAPRLPRAGETGD